MRTCKFCGIGEDVKHINRDNLCTRCYRVLEKVRRGVASAEENEWHEEMCRFNMQHGMFVPVARRRDLAYLKPMEPWACRRCGTTVEANKDNGYKNYCVVCADEIRANRVAGQKTRSKTRSDKGGTHAGYRRPSMAAHKPKLFKQ